MPRYNLERPKECNKNRHTVPDINLGEKICKQNKLKRVLYETESSLKWLIPVHRGSNNLLQPEIAFEVELRQQSHNLRQR